jgi:GNAT superfamily N-acetyltransferase
MQIREAALDDAPRLARVRVDSWRSTYRGMIPDAYLDGMSYPRAESIWTQTLQADGRQGHTLVAVEQRRVIGFAIGGPDRDSRPGYTGEIYALYLLKEYQGRGIGSQLVYRMADWLSGNNMFSMMIWVLEQNPARKFYEALGGQVVDSKGLIILDAQLKEIGYGWKDIRPLARLAHPVSS